MANGEIGISIVSDFVQRDFKPSDIRELWENCPNGMLWEAIRAEDAMHISKEDILHAIKRTSEVYILSEPLPAFYQSTEPVCSCVSSSGLLADFSEYTKAEPLYLINKDFSWMIALTTENTPSGEQLCVLMKNFGMK